MCEKGAASNNTQLLNKNLIDLRSVWGKGLVNKLWPSLYKRAELDLRLTKYSLNKYEKVTRFV